MRVMMIALTTAPGYLASLGIGRRPGSGGSTFSAAFVSGGLLVLTGMITVLMTAARAAEPADVPVL
jgi:hypothetical protein